MVEVLGVGRAAPEVRRAVGTLRRAAEAVLARHRLAEAEVTVSLVGDGEVRELNRRYRGRDEATDVLSFPLRERAPAGEGPGIAPAEGAPLLLGDVVISLDTAARQAAAYGHSLERELAFLAVHGVLHLLGYDHGTAEEERVMSAEAETVLGALGLAR